MDNALRVSIVLKDLLNQHNRYAQKAFIVRLAFQLPKHVHPEHFLTVLVSHTDFNLVKINTDKSAIAR